MMNPVWGREPEPAGDRWDALFGDLEGQAADLAAAELAAEVADRTRREVALLRLVDRLRPAVDTLLRIGLVTGETVRARLARVGSDWLLGCEDHPGEREVLIPLASLVSVAGLGRLSSAPGSEGQVAAKLDFRMALRALARDRAGVAVQVQGGGTLAGVVGRVGADFLELADHPGRGLEAGWALPLTVPIQAVVLVRRL